MASKALERLGLYTDYIGIMEKKMETTGIRGIIWGIYRGNIGLIEKKMETTGIMIIGNI